VLRLRLRDGSTLIVREAVVGSDSIVGLPWGDAPAGSRVAVARAQVERIEVGKTDKLRTAGVIVGIVLGVLGGLAWLVVSSPWHEAT